MLSYLFEPPKVCTCRDVFGVEAKPDLCVVKGAKVTPATPGESKAGWSETRADGSTSYVPLDSEPNQ